VTNHIRRAAAAAALACAAALALPAAADAACALKAMTVPVTMEGLQPLIKGKINGRPVTLLLDSGAFYTSLDARFAADAGVKAVTRAVTGSHFAQAFHAVTTGAAGIDTQAGVVVAPSFEFDGGSFKNMAFITGAIGDRAGLLGQNFLHQTDDEYDFKNGVMRFVRPEGCEGTQMAYWATPQMTYSVLDIDTGGRFDGHTLGTVTINGLKMRALFDTGAGTSFITQRAAARAGVKVTDPGARYVGHSRGLDSDHIKTWVAPFASVKIGDEEIKNTQLAIGDSEASDFDILIGADFFLAHHVYVANSQGKLYFTYNGGPVFNLTASEDAEATAKP